MHYNILGELSTFIFSILLLIFVVNTVLLYRKRRKLFVCCIASITISTLLNMISIYCIENWTHLPLWLCWTVTMLYFITIAVMPLFFSFYTYEICSADTQRHKVLRMVIWLPFLCNCVILVVNIFNGWIFSYNETTGYVRGPFKSVTYFLLVVYAAIGCLIANKFRKNLSKRTYFIILIYPFLSIAIMLIQLLNQSLIVTGTAAFAPIMLIYLSAQNDLNDYDFITGLYTVKHLRYEVNRLNHGILLVMFIHNIKEYRTNFLLSDMEKIYVRIGRFLSELSAKNAYLISEGRFALILPEDCCIEDYIEKINEFVTSEELQKDEFNYSLDYNMAGFRIPEHAKNYEEAMQCIYYLLNKVMKAREFVFCDDKFVKEIARQKQIQEILKRELTMDSKQLQVYYQPIYSVGQHRFAYLEALCRLIDTEIGNIPPSEFIPIAENCGLIEKLGSIVLERVCQFIRDNKDIEGFYGVSVNFSAVQMMNPHISDYVLETIKRYQVPVNQLIIEITESVVIRNFEEVKEKMKYLEAKGIKFYLDDFGTGFSNFNNVIELPFHMIKLDRSLVLAMEHSEKGVGIISSLTSAFQQNGIDVLAEGVENEEQDKLVRNAGVGYIQGFLYAKPQSGDESMLKWKERS